MALITLRGEAMVYESLANADDDGDKVFFSICDEPEVYVDGDEVECTNFNDDETFRRRFVQSIEAPYVFRIYDWYEIETQFEIEEEFDIDKLELPYINDDDCISDHFISGVVMQYIKYNGRYIYNAYDNTEDTEYYTRSYRQIELDSIS